MSTSEKEIEKVIVKKKSVSAPSSRLIDKLMRILLCSYADPRRILQPRKIYQTPNDRNFNIDIQIETCVHGYLSRATKQRASLVVFGVQFNNLGRKGHVNRFKMNVGFEEIPGTESSSPPSIIRHAPFATEEKLKATSTIFKKKEKNETNIYADIDVVGGRAGIQETISQEAETASVRKYFGRGASGTVSDEEGNNSSIWWNVKRSSDPDVTKDDAGVDANYRFAVLLTRQNKEDFRIRLKLFVDAGWRHKAKNLFSQTTIIKGELPSLIFRPRVWYEGHCEGIDRTRLGYFNQKGRLEDLTRSGR